jgi:hypothetical protein
MQNDSNKHFQVEIWFNFFILPQNVQQGLHACDTAADRSLTFEQNWQWDEFFARNEVQLEHNEFQQLEEFLLHETKQQSIRTYSKMYFWILVSPYDQAPQQRSI